MDVSDIDPQVPTITSEAKQVLYENTGFTNIDWPFQVIWKCHYTKSCQENVAISPVFYMTWVSLNLSNVDCDILQNTVSSLVE